MLISNFGWTGGNAGGGGGGTGTVTLITASTGMSFPPITTTGGIAIDTTKVPYYSGGFGGGGFAVYSGGAWSFDNNTYVPITRSITINGLTQDLSSNRTWSVGTVTNVSALTIGTSGTDIASSVANSTTTPIITLNVPTASATNRGALSSADWTAFNNKFDLPALTSGSVLFSNGTTIAQDNSNFFWDNTLKRLGIGTNSPTETLSLVGNFAIGEGGNIVLGTATGTKIGTSATQRLGFYGVTPIVQPTAVSSPQGIATALTSLGLLDTSTINSVNLTTTGSSGASTYTQVTNTLNIPDYSLALVNYVPLTRTISTTSPLAGGGNLSSDLTLSMPQASGSVDGYLSSGDWTTFNNKLSSAFNQQFQDEGANITQRNIVNFVGAGVSVIDTGSKTQVTITGGQGNTPYYMNLSVSETPYNQFSSSPTAAAQQTATQTISGGATVTIAAFQTPTGVPNTTNLIAGLWTFFNHFSTTSGSPNFTTFVEVYKRTVGGVETLLLTTDPISTTTLSTTPTMLLTDGVLPTTTLLTSDRIVVKVRVTNNNISSEDITFYTEGSTYYSVSYTTLGVSIPSGAVTNVTASSPLSSSGGTTPNITITQATSLTNGYLSSTDWNTFNNKFDLPALTSGSVLFSNGTTIAQDNSNFFWDNTTKRLGIGTNSPSERLSLVGGNFSIDDNSNIVLGTTTGTKIGTATNQLLGFYGVTPIAQPVSTTTPQGIADALTNLGLLASSTINSITLTTSGSSGASTYTQATNTLNIPNYSSALTGYVPTTRTISTTAPLTGGGALSSDLTLSMPQANGSTDGYLSQGDWTTFNNKGNGTVTNVSALTIGTSGTDIASSVANSTTTPVITLNVPTASATNRGALSSADWTTFNNKVSSGSITTSGLTMNTNRLLGRTTGSSGAVEEIQVTFTGTTGSATFSGGILNIPNYSGAGYISSVWNVTTQTGASYSAANNDYVVINATTFTVNLPAISTAGVRVGIKMVGVPASSTAIQVLASSATAVIDGQVSNVLNATTNLYIYNQWDAYTLVSYNDGGVFKWAIES